MEQLASYQMHIYEILNLFPLRNYLFSRGEVKVESGSESCTKTEGQPLLTHGSAAFETKRTVSKNSKIFSGSMLA
jgi:hypothetical protein